MSALNEEDNIIPAIDHTLRALDELGIEGEIIVVSDGSTDNTAGLVKQKMEEEKRVDLLIHDAPQGIGASFWDSIDAAKGDIVALFPADNENYPKETLRYFKLFYDVDMVIPFVFNKEVRPLCRNIISGLYRFIINSTFSTSLNYTNGTVLYRKSILKCIRYRCRGFFFQTDLVIRLIKKGYLFAEVPCRLGTRKEGTSKALSFSSLYRVMRDYLKLARDYYFTAKFKRDMDFPEDSLTYIRRKTDKQL